MNNVLNIVINIQNTTIFEPVILTGFYTSLLIIYNTYYLNELIVPLCERITLTVLATFFFC